MALDLLRGASSGLLLSVAVKAKCDFLTACSRWISTAISSQTSTCRCQASPDLIRLG
jgi:putative component of membrane protein insertase Oxa1/YidC/SpoIIIJ protein YidD